MKRASIAMAVVLGFGLLAGQAGRAAELEVPAPMVAPPPPRILLDPATDNAGPAADGTLTPAQRTHCQALLDKINALPSGPQWSASKSSVTTPDGGSHPMLERQADRKQLNEAYRQECAQQKR
ncbi:hypothetical protein P3W85_05325 [Cupriavidus basilensis]|uniref:Uncharacterized protein n=1 Tax=Cupriavidus basilensis TaxID=68895 RepID=A0ABT6AID7_9BURK|nr:hypothetical protein [Cupriavidus basilensis]MDF3832367.1 hypothetical protein [Cupriavidus basilensis]